LGDLLVIPVFEVAREQNLAISLGEPGQPLADLFEQVPPGDLVSGIARSRTEPLGEGKRRVLGEPRFAIDRAALGQTMAAAKFDQAFAGRFLKPQPERHRPASEEIVEAAQGGHVGFLDDVRRVDPALEFAIETQLDELAQRLAVAREERIERREIPGGRLFQQPSSLV